MKESKEIVSPSSQKPELSRRRLLQLLAGTAAFTGLAYLTKFPVVRAQGGTIPQPTVTPEAPAGFENARWIWAINDYATAKKYPFRLSYDPNTESNIESTREVSDIFKAWGNTVEVVPPLYPSERIDMPVLFDAMNRIKLPVSQLRCDSATTPSFLKFYDKNNTYSFVADDQGYRLEEQAIASIASVPETESDELDLPLIVEPIEMHATVAGAQEFHSPEGFEEAIVAMQAQEGDGTTLFSQELYPFIRDNYDKQLVDIVTADGQFPYNDDAVLFSPQRLRDVMNLPQMEGYAPHAVLSQVALKVALPDGYRGYQMNPSDVPAFLDMQLSLGSYARPSVVAYPYSLNDPFVFNIIENALEGKNPDETKTILATSTYNKQLISTLDKPIKPGMVCFTTVRKDENGDLFMPTNRSYIVNDERMFGFPDNTNAVTPRLGAKKMSDAEMKLFLTYEWVKTSGASLSTLQGGPFIGAVISKLLKEGNPYTEKLVMDTLWNLCPSTQVGNAVLRVPNINKVRAFFGESLHIPQLMKAQ